jgi:protein-tyrosine phosphatase
MGFLDLFKKNNQQIQPLMLDWLEVDMHSHLIPGIDDGSKSVEESVALIKRFQGYGIKRIITTPHIMSEYYKNTPEIINNGLEELKNALENEGIDLKIDAAAEYFLDDVFLEKIRNGEKLLTISRNYILVETGFNNKPQLLLDILQEIETSGYKPVLAHPERYIYLIEDNELLHKLFDRDIYFQLNLLSLTGFYSKPVKSFGEKLVDEQKIRFLGTDCHNHRYLDVLETLPNSKYYAKLKELYLLNRGL